MNTFEGTNISGDCLVNKKLPDIYLFFLFPRLFTRLHIAFMISVEGKKIMPEDLDLFVFLKGRLGNFSTIYLSNASIKNWKSAS